MFNKVWNLQRYVQWLCCFYGGRRSTLWINRISNGYKLVHTRSSGQQHYYYIEMLENVTGPSNPTYVSTEVPELPTSPIIQHQWLPMGLDIHHSSLEATNLWAPKKQPSAVEQPLLKDISLFFWSWPTLPYCIKKAYIQDTNSYTRRSHLFDCGCVLNGTAKTWLPIKRSSLPFFWHKVWRPYQPKTHYWGHMLHFGEQNHKNDLNQGTHKKLTVKGRGDVIKYTKLTFYKSIPYCKASWGNSWGNVSSKTLNVLTRTPHFLILCLFLRWL